MDADTRAFIELLTQPFEVRREITQKIPGTPYSETVTVIEETRVTIKALKLERANKIWIKDHPECEPKKTEKSA